MERNRDSHALPLLLSMLRDKKPGSSIMSLVNATTIDLICKLFSREDYVSFAAQVTNISVAKDLLDFILHLLHDPRLMTLNGTMDIKRRGRRFIMKVITKTPVIPESLIVTGIKTAEHDHVGRGGFGHVFMGELQGNAVALKVLYKADNNVAFCREALMWRSLRHKFVLPFLGIYQDEAMEQLFLVSPYMKNGTLAQWRKKVNPSVAEIEQRVLEVAKGLEYIHLEGIVHGDLRGVNVLLDADLHVQIADFGLTRLSEATNTRSGALHLNFAAPELFGFCEDDDSDDDDDVPMRTQRSDVYAFGCLYYEIHYDSIPFVGKTDKQIMKYLSRGAHPPRLPEPPLNDGAWELIRSCWVREASNRPRIEEVTKRMIRASPDPSYEAKIGSEKLDEASNKRRKNEARYNRPIGSRPLTKHNAKNHMEFHVNLNDWICEACGEGLTTGSTPIRHLTVCKKRKGQLGETKDARTLGASGLPYILSSPNAERLYYQQSPRRHLPDPHYQLQTEPESPTLDLTEIVTMYTARAPTARDPSYETPPRAPPFIPSTGPPSNTKDLSASLKASLEYYCSVPMYGHPRFRCPTTHQSDKNFNVLAVWRYVTSNFIFKDEDLYRLYTVLTASAKCDGKDIVLEPWDMSHILPTFVWQSNTSDTVNTTSNQER